MGKNDIKKRTKHPKREVEHFSWTQLLSHFISSSFLWKWRKEEGWYVCVKEYEKEKKPQKAPWKSSCNNSVLNDTPKLKKTSHNRFWCKPSWSVILNQYRWFKKVTYIYTHIFISIHICIDIYIRYIHIYTCTYAKPLFRLFRIQNMPTTSLSRLMVLHFNLQFLVFPIHQNLSKSWPTVHFWIHLPVSF